MTIVEWILLPGSSLIAAVAAFASLICLIWAIIGKRDLRVLRLRYSLAGVFIMVAAIAGGIALIYFVVQPSVVFSQSAYQPPYELGHKVLSVTTLVSITMAAGLGVWSLLATSTGKKRIGLALGSVFLFAVISAANWMLLYSIQYPAHVRYLMIESQDWRTHVGQIAPDIEYAMLDGSHPRLSELRGKVVLVNFFATWCVPCLRELPHLQDLWNEFGPDVGYYEVVIGCEETQESVLTFETENGYTFPMAVDHDATAFHTFAKEGVPRTYLISRDGTILFQSIGFDEGIDVYKCELIRLRRAIKEALKPL